MFWSPFRQWDGKPLFSGEIPLLFLRIYPSLLSVCMSKNNCKVIKRHLWKSLPCLTFPKELNRLVAQSVLSLYILTLGFTRRFTGNRRHVIPLYRAAKAVYMACQDFLSYFWHQGFPPLKYSTFEGPGMWNWSWTTISKHVIIVEIKRQMKLLSKLWWFSCWSWYWTWTCTWGNEQHYLYTYKKMLVAGSVWTLDYKQSWWFKSNLVLYIFLENPQKHRKPWNDKHWETVICGISPCFVLGSPWLIVGREAIHLRIGLSFELFKKTKTNHALWYIWHAIETVPTSSYTDIAILYI